MTPEIQIIGLLIAAAWVGLQVVQAFTGRTVANTKQVEAETNRENVVTVFATTFEARSNAQQEQLFKLNGEFNRERGRHEVSEENSAIRINALEAQVKDMEIALEAQQKKSDDERAGYERRISELETEQKRLKDVIAARDETITRQEETITELKEQVKILTDTVKEFIAAQVIVTPSQPEKPPPEDAL